MNFISEFIIMKIVCAVQHAIDFFTPFFNWLNNSKLHQFIMDQSKPFMNWLTNTTFYHYIHLFFTDDTFSTTLLLAPFFQPHLYTLWTFLALFTSIFSLFTTSTIWQLDTKTGLNGKDALPYLILLSFMPVMNVLIIWINMMQLIDIIFYNYYAFCSFVKKSIFFIKKYLLKKKRKEV